MTPPDPELALYEKMKTANVKLDAALDDMEEGLQRAKKLSPIAGGNVTTALINVASLFNSGGEALSDLDDVAASFEDFKKDFAAQDDHRLRSIESASNALEDVREAGDILDDLKKGVPADRAQALQGIVDDSDDAEANLVEAIKGMGGKVKAEDDSADSSDSLTSTNGP
jgi:ABC-type transporter Mla subunit MlaD